MTSVVLDMFETIPTLTKMHIYFFLFAIVKISLTHICTFSSVSTFLNFIMASGNITMLRLFADNRQNMSANHCFERLNQTHPRERIFNNFPEASYISFVCGHTKRAIKNKIKDIR